MSATPAPSGADDADRGTSPPDIATTGRLVDAFEAGRKRRAVEEAAEIRLMADAAAAVARPPHASADRARRAELDRRALVADLATSCRVSEWTVTRLMTEASDLCVRFAPAVEALERGEISRQHLSVIHDTGNAIEDDDALARFVGLALARASSLTPGRLAPVLRAIAERFREQTLGERHQEAAERRRIEIADLPDDMAALTAILPATLAYGIHDRLTQQARSVVAAREPAVEESQEGESTDDDPDANRDTRTMDQLRADVFTDTLLTAGPTDCVAGTGLDAIRATVQVTIPVLTMTGASAEPVLLAGYGPIDADTARVLAAGAQGWERVMTSPIIGSVLAVDRYRPGPPLQRFLAARDEHCRFPGCRRPVRRCDRPHDRRLGGRPHVPREPRAPVPTAPHPQGVTAWMVEQVSPGVLVWTSPTGRVHTDRPEPVVRFVEDDAAVRRRAMMREPWLFAVDDPPGSPGVPPF